MVRVDLALGRGERAWPWIIEGERGIRVAIVALVLGRREEGGGTHRNGNCGDGALGVRRGGDLVLNQALRVALEEDDRQAERQGCAATRWVT